jgi:hypothetical protein
MGIVVRYPAPVWGRRPEAAQESSPPVQGSRHTVTSPHLGGRRPRPAPKDERKQAFTQPAGDVARRSVGGRSETNSGPRNERGP